MSELHSLPQEIKQHIEEIARGIIPEAPDNMAPQQVIAYNAQVRTVLDAICENIEHFVLLRLYDQGVRTVEFVETKEVSEDRVVLTGWGQSKENEVLPFRSKNTVTRKVSATKDQGGST